MSKRLADCVHCRAELPDCEPEGRPLGMEWLRASTVGLLPRLRLVTGTRRHTPSVHTTAVSASGSTGQCLRMSKAARLAKAPPKEWPTANTNTNTNDNDNDTREKGECSKAYLYVCEGIGKAGSAPKAHQHRVSVPGQQHLKQTHDYASLSHALCIGLGSQHRSGFLGMKKYAPPTATAVSTTYTGAKPSQDSM
ncbi:MAG: hypothetical protein FRX49_01968 [Trebouxia sp. A1-2]|nr:MAG: hypothetical protein FRX49_01968 [Trebouxia sp. A1-2]